MDRGAWWATVHGVSKELDTIWWLSTHTHSTGHGAGANAKPLMQGRDRSRTFRVQCLLHDDLHPLHVVPVPEAVQGRTVLVSERQDLGHYLPWRKTAELWVSLGTKRES